MTSTTQNMATETERDSAVPSARPQQSYDALAALDWDFADAEGGDALHNLHPYPAKFIPEIPRALIDVLSSPGDLVLDMFSGGGTTAIEALRAGRNFHGIDANPLAAHISKVKSSRFNEQSMKSIAELVDAAPMALKRSSIAAAWAPEIPNVDRWYAPEVFNCLTHLREIVMAAGDSSARNLALLVFANVAAKASYQESATRYVSKPRAVLPNLVVAQFNKELLRSARVLKDEKWSHQAASIKEGDARDPDLYPTGVALAVTSPPYPNAFDYHLYHRFRLFWLGPGPQSLRRLEIGSHLKHQSEQQPAESYVSDMTAVLENTRQALKPGGWAVLVVGDGIFKGVTFETARELRSVAAGLGYETFPALNRQLPEHKRSVTSAGRRLKQEQILILRKPESKLEVTLLEPSYELYDYERRLRTLELASSNARVVTGGTSEEGPLRVSVDVSDVSKLDGLAFSGALLLPGGTVRPTYSAILESGPSLRKKNSTYLGHGIHRYKGKFYPQLAKALLNASGVQLGGLVIDPFGGSGTVALEANLAGIHAISMDCNPVATATARAKTDLIHLPRNDVREFLRALVALSARSPRISGSDLRAFAEGVVQELVSWFPAPVLAKLDFALKLVRSFPDSRLVNMGEVLISDIVRDVSQQEPKDLRIRRRAEPIHDAPVFELLSQRADNLLAKYEAYIASGAPALPNPGTANVVFGDSTDSNAFPSARADALVSSPPYAAALPYIDTDRLSIAAIFGHTSRERRPLEATMVGSRDITASERAYYESLLDGEEVVRLPDSTKTWLADYLRAVREDEKAGFRRKQAPAVLTRYFMDMSSVLTNAYSHLRENADVWLVLGDSRSTIAGKRWVIPTVAEVRSIAEHCGYRFQESLPITVTREDRLHSRNAIVENSILHFTVS
jgi:DNA modification methylase